MQDALLRKGYHSLTASFLDESNTEYFRKKTMGLTTAVVRTSLVLPNKSRHCSLTRPFTEQQHHPAREEARPRAAAARRPRPPSRRWPSLSAPPRPSETPPSPRSAACRTAPRRRRPRSTRRCSAQRHRCACARACVRASGGCETTDSGTAVVDKTMRYSSSSPFSHGTAVGTDDSIVSIPSLSVLPDAWTFTLTLGRKVSPVHEGGKCIGSR